MLVNRVARPFRPAVGDGVIQDEHEGDVGIVGADPVVSEHRGVGGLVEFLWVVSFMPYSARS